jgi:large subunit ribosomal protein L13
MPYFRYISLFALCFEGNEGNKNMPRQTTFAKQGEVEPNWRHVDAAGQTLGRMATTIATHLMGKHRPEWTPHVLTGDFVIVTNAGKVKMTGKKFEQKTQLIYSGYPGGLKAHKYSDMLEKHPERIIEQAVRRMLPKTKLGRDMFRRLKVYAGSTHPHANQKPEALPC